MIGVAPFPVRQNHYARPLRPDDSRNFQAIFKGVFDAPIGDIERLAPRDFQNAGGVGCFTGTVFGSAPCSHFTAGQIEYPSAITALRHFEQRATAGLLDVITMGGDGEHIERRRAHDGGVLIGTGSPKTDGGTGCGSSGKLSSAL